MEQLQRLLFFTSDFAPGFPLVFFPVYTAGMFLVVNVGFHGDNGTLQSCALNKASKQSKKLYWKLFYKPITQWTAAAIYPTQYTAYRNLNLFVLASNEKQHN